MTFLFHIPYNYNLVKRTITRGHHICYKSWNFHSIRLKHVVHSLFFLKLCKNIYFQKTSVKRCNWVSIYVSIMWFNQTVPNGWIEVAAVSISCVLLYITQNESNNWPTVHWPGWDVSTVSSFCVPPTSVIPLQLHLQ